VPTRPTQIAQGAVFFQPRGLCKTVNPDTVLFHESVLTDWGRAGHGVLEPHRASWRRSSRSLTTIFRSALQGCCDSGLRRNTRSNRALTLTA